MVSCLGKDSYDVNDLREIVRILRAPGGCPWDREQTHASIRRNFLEEAYEAVEAIDEQSPDHLREELGDVLLQVALHAQMEEEAGRFDLNGVADGICKKLIYRHPHIFGEVSVSGSDEVLRNWEELKRAQRGHTSHADTADAVTHALPALMRAEKVQKVARKAGFDWPDVTGAMDKLCEEADELRAAIADGTNVFEELGDLLFAAVNVSRFLGVDAEHALTAATAKFSARFRKVEALARAEGREMTAMTLEELDGLWDQVKRLNGEQSL